MAGRGDSERNSGDDSKGAIDMAGRPKTMLKKIDVLATSAHELKCAIEAVCPDQYKKDDSAEGGDGVALAWHEATKAVEGAWMEILGLACTLQQKAGCKKCPLPDEEDGPCPIATVPPGKYHFVECERMR
jgi:hypothetical protein